MSVAITEYHQTIITNIAKLILLTKNRLPTDFNVYISKRTGKMRWLFWNVDALLPELVFEKTNVYYVNFWNLWFSIDLPIRNHPNSSLLTCFHVFLMFYIISDDFLNFWKFSFSELRRHHFWTFSEKFRNQIQLKFQSDYRKLKLNT